MKTRINFILLFLISALISTICLAQIDYPSQSHLTKSGTLIASTFLGGTNTDGEIYSCINRNQDGYVYVTGVTASMNFPVTSEAFDQDYNGGGTDVFVSKFSSDLSNLLASTYLGGEADEYSTSIIFDKFGNVIIAGATGSRIFPCTPGAYDTSYNGNPNGLGLDRDVFVAKFSNDLSELLACTYLGGYDQDGGWYTNLTIDTLGRIYVGSATYSSDFPTTPGAYDSTINFVNDVFVSVFNNQLNQLITSTLIGSSGWDACYDIKLDASGHIYICGIAGGPDFPTTPGAYQQNFVYYGDTFISEFNNGLSDLLASTYLGGSNIETAYGLVFDQTGNVIVAGKTESWDFPVTPESYDSLFNGNSDIFISRLNSALTNLLCSTYLGGWYYDAFYGLDLSIDNLENIYVASGSSSPDFPVTSQAYDNTFNGDQDVIISKLDLNLGRLIASTFIGADDEDYAVDIKYNDNSVLVTGQTWSSGYPCTQEAFDTSYNYTGDLFITEIDDELSGLITEIPSNENDFQYNFKLYANYPNPFNPVTIIKYYVPMTSNISLIIYDFLGREIQTLVNKEKVTGTYTVKFDGTNFASGVYFCVMKSANFIDTKKLVLIK